MTIPPEITRKLGELQQRIAQADALERARRVDEAQAAYQACLQMASAGHFPIMVQQLTQIWMGFGFCCTNRNDWAGALEWYRRVEAVIQSAPSNNPNPTSPEAQAHAQQWTRFLPKDVQVLFPADYPVEQHLANLYDSMALACDNAGQLDAANGYYQRSTALYAKLGNAIGEAQVWWHQAMGCQRRQAWFELEIVAEKMRFAAAKAEAKPILLAARRFLAQSQINQQRPFKTLEHLGEVVLLGRELNDNSLARDEALFRDLIGRLRPGVLQRGEPPFLAPLVRAESIANDPNLKQDEALLQQWQSEQPVSQFTGGPLNSLTEVASILQDFALRHCGAPKYTEKRAPQGWMDKLTGAAETVERRVWAISQEELQTFHKDQQGQLVPGKALCAVLSIFGQPEAIISVSLAASQCNVMVMEERMLTGTNQSGFFSVARESTGAQSELLANCLNSFIQRGLFAKTDQGLRYVSPKHS